MWKQVSLAGLVAVVAFAVACGGDDEIDAPSSPPDDSGAASSVAMGPGLTIAEAKASELDGPLLVNGFLVAVGDRVQLCSTLLESFPPQCGGESLVVEGLDLASVNGTQTEGDTTWTSDAIQLLGEVEDGVITVSQMSSG